MKRDIRPARSKVLDKRTVLRRRAARKAYAKYLKMPCENHGVVNCQSCPVP